jgi:hypothetical protein
LRKELPLLITLLSGLAVLFGKWSAYGAGLRSLAFTDEINVTIQVMAFLIGAINLSRIHGMNIIRRRSGFFYSIVLVLAIWGYFGLGAFEGFQGKNFRWIYFNIYYHMESSMFALLCFYIASAAYRAFRVRTREATVLLLAAALVMLGRAPLGEAIWSEFGNIYNWIMRIPNTAGMRGIELGAYLGAFVTALRILLGIERAHLGGLTGSR